MPPLPLRLRWLGVTFWSTPFWEHRWRGYGNKGLWDHCETMAIVLSKPRDSSATYPANTSYTYHLGDARDIQESNGDGTQLSALILYGETAVWIPHSRPSVETRDFAGAAPDRPLYVIFAAFSGAVWKFGIRNVGTSLVYKYS